MTVGRTFHLLRHAHSSWAVPGQRDHQRVLDDRGRADAAQLASKLGPHARNIGAVVCSTAVRARQTLDLVRPALPVGASVRYSDDLYALGPEAYEAEVRAFDGPGEILLVGHNPTIEQLVFDVCTQDSAAMRRARTGVGTANWLILEKLADSAEGAMRGVLHELLTP